MILASHNTFTYLKPYYWILRPFHFMAKCQSETVEKQFEEGARVFDVRIHFDKRNSPFFAHGAMRFSGDVFNYLEILNNLSSTCKKPVCIRLIKERSGKDKAFIAFCTYVLLKYKHLKFFCGRDKKTWKVVYKFRKKELDIVQKHASWNNDLPNKEGTGYLLDDAAPFIYAKRNNKKWLEEYKDKDVYLMIDFIGKYGFDA